MTIRLGAVNHRWQLGDLLNDRGLVDQVVEVGTHQADFAVHLRRVWKGRCLYCVDPWAVPPGYEEQVPMLSGSNRGDRNADYREAERRVREWLVADPPRVCLLRAESPGAAEFFPDGGVDMVYLDGDHRDEAVRRDLDAWWPKVRRGGLLAGHDFICPGETYGGWGGCIQPAVLDFARREGRDVFIVPENGPGTAGTPWSFYLEKP